MELFIDLETYCSVDLTKTGVYPYFESADFEILLVGYAVDDGPVIVFEWGDLPARQKFEKLLPQAELIAHNAAFERLAFRAKGYYLPVWTCTMVRAMYCGLPPSLAQAGEALGLSVQKDAAGGALIRYWSLPCKPTKANGGRTRNMPGDNPGKWQAFCDYLRDDVATTRELYRALEPFRFTEQENYLLDQKINDTGILVDAGLVDHAIELDRIAAHELSIEARKLTGLDNPNSLPQLAGWLTDQTGKEIESLRKDAVIDMLASAEGNVKRALELRLQSSKTSVKKYQAARNYLCRDNRARGVFQFYGAGRTGRWAGRGIQVQNMPRNYMRTLGLARDLARSGDLETFNFLYDDPQQVLKELIRTMLIPEPGNVFLVADFSAIEARVLSWLSGERWRIEVFETHGKIYEASAAAMFGVPIEQIGKSSPYRQRGKIAELALGYQGGVGALKQMGGEKMGLDENEMGQIVKRWRKANPSIARYWSRVEEAAKRAVRDPGRRVKLGAISFFCESGALIIELPSGRWLVYQSPRLMSGRFGETLTFFGVDQTTRKYTRQDTYGGKLVENIVQAVSRDLLAYSMRSVDASGFRIVLHVHDEIVAEHPGADPARDLRELIKVMTEKPDWAEGLPLNADGFTSHFYQKD